MTRHVNREDVDRRLDRLQEEYGQFPVVDDESTAPTEAFDDFLEMAEGGYTGGGYAWVVRDPDQRPPLSESMPEDVGSDRSRVLLILERGVDGPRWSLPGGTREDDETYEDAAVREVREETGVDVELEAPALVYRSRATPEDDRQIVVHSLWVDFDARYAGGSIDVQEGELRGAAWFEDPPSELHPQSQYHAGQWWEEYDPVDAPEV